MNAHGTKNRERRRCEMERNLETANLKAWIKPGMVIYSVVCGRSRTGLSRTLEFYVVFNREICRITWSVAKILTMPYDDRVEAVRMKGCGIDAGRDIVERLGSALFNDPQKLRHRRL